MKIISFWRNLTKKNAFAKKEKKYYFLTINEEEVENARVICFHSHHNTYKLLREFKAPQYENIYLMKRKKGFNTLFFNQGYDIVICDVNGVVIDTIIDARPGFFSNHYPDSHFIYFFVVGSINHHNIKPKNRLRISKKRLTDAFY